MYKTQENMSAHIAFDIVLSGKRRTLIHPQFIFNN